MNDFSSFSIPPRDIQPIEGPQPGKSTKMQPKQDPGEFKNQLIQALGQIGQDADQMSSASLSNVQDVETAMDQAKHAFDDTMQTHQLMQKLMNQMPDIPDQSQNDDE